MNKKRMHAHYLQHVPFEGLGSIESWLKKTGYEVSCSQFFNSVVLPQIEDIDFLIIMGGPMSVNDEAEHPWLIKEKEFIRNVIKAGKPVLGVCLGAQLIANAMGGKVFSNPIKEIGWFPIQAVDSQDASVFQFPKEIEAFHWHGETFSLPKDAVHLAKNNACNHQAFQIGNNVIGLQCHLETSPSSIQALVKSCKDELIEDKYIQSEATILSASQERYLSSNSLMESVLEYLHAV